MLNNTSTGSRTLSAQVTWNGDTETCLIGTLLAAGVGSKVIVRGKRGSDYRIRSRVDNRDVRGSSMWSSDVKGHGNYLASCELLDIGGVISKLKSLAKPYVAFSGVEVFLIRGVLDKVLDISFLVTGST